MLIVIDTSVIIAVLTSEPERGRLIRVTEDADVVAPESVHWEVGNALSALLKRRLVTPDEIQQALKAYAQIPIRFLEVDLATSLEIAAKHRVHAYDAYMVTCSLAQRAPLLTLDHGLKRVATAAGITVIEVPV